MTEQQRRERTASQLKKLIEGIVPKKSVVDKRKLIDDDYKFNLIKPKR